MESTEQSRAYQVWKSFYGLSYWEEVCGTPFLFIDDGKGTKWHVDNLAIKESGEIHYLSWTENAGSCTRLIVVELEPHRHRRLEWVIEPAKGICLFWANKWTEEGLFLVYRDEVTNYALHLSFSKKPKGVSLRVTELGEMICIKKSWIIAYKSYSDSQIRLFDLKSFSCRGAISPEDAAKQQLIPSEQGEYDEELI